MDSYKTKLKWTVVKVRNRIARGQSWLYYVKDIAYVFILIYFIEDIFKRFNIYDPVLFKFMYVLFPIMYFVGCYVIGFLDEHWGIWKLESVFGSKEVNPFFEEMDEKLDFLISRR